MMLGSVSLWISLSLLIEYTDLLKTIDYDKIQIAGKLYIFNILV